MAEKKKKKPLQKAPAPKTRLEQFLPYAIGLVVFLCFLPTAWNGFINMDDLPLIVNNGLMKRGSFLDLGDIFGRQMYSPHYKPMVYFTWLLEKATFGVKPSVLHINNAILHGVNAALVYLVSLRIIPKMWKHVPNLTIAAAFTALIWGLHPLRVESVAWAVERKDMLFGLFYLLAVLNYLKSVSSKNPGLSYWLSILFYILACLSKSMGITFLGAAILIDLLFLGKKAFALPRLLQKLPMVAVLLFGLHIFGFLLAPESRAKIVSPMRRTASVPQRVATLPPAVQHAAISNMRVQYFAAHTFVPAKLALVYPREQVLSAVSPWLLPLLSIPVLFIGLLAWKSRWRPTMGFGLAWFVVTISPILISDGIGTNFLSDRYTYIPSLGLVWWVVPAILIYLNRFKAGRLTAGQILCAMLTVMLAVSTISQVLKWRNSISLWDQVIDNYPVNWYAYYNRGKLTSSSNPDQAYRDLTKSIEALGDRGETYYARGTILMQKGNYESAINDFTLAIQYLKEDSEARINRGSSYREIKQYDKAIQDFSTVIENTGFDVKAINNRGMAYSDKGDYAKALEDFNTVLKRRPKYLSALINRGNVYLKPDVAQYANAEADFQLAFELSPDDHNVAFRSAYALAQLGRHQEAITRFDKAIALLPDQGFYYFGRAQSYDALGMKDKARNDYQKAQSLGVKIDPALLGQ